MKDADLLMRMSVILCFTAVGAVHANSISVVRSQLNCRSFKAVAETKALNPKGERPVVISQNIVLRERKGGQAHELGIGHDTSADIVTGRNHALGSFADTWRCVNTGANDTYIFIEFICQTTTRYCDTAMDTGLSEWTQIYDQAGRPLVGKPPIFTSNDEARLRRLKLRDAYFRPLGRDEVDTIYVPGSPR